MKNRQVLLVFIFIWLMGEGMKAYASFIEGSIEFSHPFISPYPDVLSQPIDVLPEGFVTINVGNETFYFCNGIYYQRLMLEQKYVIVPPPIGAVVFSLPPGYQFMFIDGENYYVYAGVFYKLVLEGYKVIYPPVEAVLI